MRAIEASNSPGFPPSPQDSPDSPRGGNKQAGLSSSLRACLRRCLFSRFGGGNALYRVSVRLASKPPPQKGPFWGLIGWCIESTGAARMGDVLSPRRKASAQDAPACLCGVPDATSAVAHLP